MSASQKSSNVSTSRTRALPKLAKEITSQQVKVEKARRHQLDFMRFCWQKTTPFLIGQHTRAICEEIDQAIEQYRNGESTFLIIKVPFRHGKSDIASRYLSARFHGLFPDEEVLLATYAAELSYDFSRFSRHLIQSEQYQQVFPGIRLSREATAVQHWELEDHAGALNAVGLGGSMVGRGYALGILDDYHKNRQEAESATIRSRNWESFTNDFLTRRAPVSITIIVATPWHIDDIIGRAEKTLEEDPDFPRFRVIEFPAIDERYPSGYLFPERFPEKWYRSQAAALGNYGTASLLQCRPVARGGNVLKTDKVQIIEKAPDNLRWVRAWDLASTEKELVKQDPDYTDGILMAVEWRNPPEDADIGEKIPVIWIKDNIRGRWAAPERDRRIKQAAMIDGPSVRVGTESVAGYKDTYARVKETLQGLRTVEKVTPPGDLMVRTAPVEPIFEVGNVYLVRGDWNREFLQEIGEYPSGAHDDQVAALVTGWEMLVRKKKWGVA